VAQVLRARGADVFWIGTRAGMEARLVPEHGFDIEWIGIEGIRGKGVKQLLAAPQEADLGAARGWRDPASARPSGRDWHGRFRLRPRRLDGASAAACPADPGAEQRAGHDQSMAVAHCRRVFEAFPGSFPERGAACHRERQPGARRDHRAGAPAERFAGRSDPLACWLWAVPSAPRP
jgi:UDP-N-acetylglucosamine--N-acetylmuramyl-(pentapeptide) pyrophosphoryl-undecaprenol N-acetylglucosamine transferase